MEYYWNKMYVELALCHLKQQILSEVGEIIKTKTADAPKNDVILYLKKNIDFLTIKLLIIKWRTRIENLDNKNDLK